MTARGAADLVCGDPLGQAGQVVIGPAGGLACKGAAVGRPPHVPQSAGVPRQHTAEVERRVRAGLGARANTRHARGSGQ